MDKSFQIECAANDALRELDSSIVQQGKDLSVAMMGSFRQGFRAGVKWALRDEKKPPLKKMSDAEFTLMKAAIILVDEIVDNKAENNFITMTLARDILREPIRLDGLWQVVRRGMTLDDHPGKNTHEAELLKSYELIRAYHKGEIKYTFEGDPRGDDKA